MRVPLSLPLCGVGLALLATSGSGIQAQQTRRAGVRPTEQLSIPGVSASISELAELQRLLPEPQRLIEQPPVTIIDLPEIELATPRGHVKPTGSILDPVQQLLGLCSVDLTSKNGFASQGDTPDGTLTVYIPPDVAGAVGPDHLMTMLLNQVLIQDRVGNTLVNMDPSVFWSPLSGSAINFPRVSFDATTSRFIASARSGAGGTMELLLAVSQTDDPTGTWDFHAIPADPTNLTFPDWCPSGYNGTWITISANMFNVAGGAFAGAKAWVADKSTIGGALTVSVFAAGFTAAVHGNGGNSTMPSRAMDNLDPNMYLVNDTFSSGGTMLLQFTQISGTGAAPVAGGLLGSPFGGANSLFFVTTNFSTTQRTMPQVGDARFISPFSVRVASVAQRNGKLWVANSGGLPGPSTNAAPTHSGVIWHEANPALTPATPMVQSGAIMGANAGSTALYPSVAVNCGEDVLIGYAFGDATRNPECAYSVRLGTDPANFMGPITLLKAGESSYWKNFGVGTTAQYGLYSSTSVDPNDDTTMWTLQQYAAQRVGVNDNDSRWGTWWGRVGECDEPTITDEPDPLTICVGDSAMFSVSATASNAGALTYQWRKDGVDLPGETGSTLTIASAIGADAGLYDVLVHDYCGTQESVAVQLDIPAALITLQPVDVSTGLGTPASFTVAAVGQGTLFYQWRQDGNDILGANSSTYNIAAVGPADYGFYDCVITDDCGPVTSDSAELKYGIKSGKHQPAELSFHILAHPESTFGCAAGEVTFEVLAYPEGVTYQWRKDGNDLGGETGSTLTLSNISNLDNGGYDVVVTHGAQTKTSDEALLAVLTVATITDQPDSVDAQLGDSVTFSVTAIGDGPITYQWEKKSNPFVPFQPIANQIGPDLTFEDVKNGNSGSYRCVVSNPCGGVVSDVAVLSIIF
jgi:hypothetical protein